MPRPHNNDAKRQMSLQEQQQFALNCQRRAEAGEMTLRRYHSERTPNDSDDYVAVTQRIGRDTPHSPYPAAPHSTNISTVSVNSNIIAPTNKTQSTGNRSHGGGAKVTKNNGTLTGVTRSKTQWTLLCSGASLMDCIEDSSRIKATPAKLTTANEARERRDTSKRQAIAASNNDTLTTTKATSIAAVKSSSLPLTGASTIFLGECEMPITREYGMSKKYSERERERERSRDRNRERELEWERQCALDYYRQPLIYREIRGADDNRMINEREENENYAVNVYNERYNLNFPQHPTASEYGRPNNNYDMVNSTGRSGKYNCIPAAQAAAAAVKILPTPIPTKTATSTSVLTSKHAKPLPTTATTTRRATTLRTNTTAMYSGVGGGVIGGVAGMPHMRGRHWRSNSLPNIWLSSNQSSPRASNPNALPAVNDVKSGFSSNLAHQMRAVSSPSLTDALQAEAVNDTSAGNAGTKTVLKDLQANSTDSCASGESTPTMVTATANSNNASNNNSHSSGRPMGGGSGIGLVTSQSVGVLQKFKRTLTNFNKPASQQQPQQQQQQQHIVNSSSTQTIALSNSTGTTLPASGSVGGINALANENQTDVTAESTTGRYRFGPLIWRSSKERRKTKYNRRDKCNSGDSGIQIELDNDEPFSRVSAATNGAASTSAAAATGRATSTQRYAREKVTLKMRSVRRTNSAKATSITEQSATAAINAKGKILKRMDMHGGSMERVAPESLPARSLSQPNGLDTCGIGRTGDMDESDSDSVTSHEEVSSNYYPIYAEVLYSFTAAGPQELGLERGTLIEILRKEVGPWWFGRIRKDENNTLVEEILDPELGWFPKEFVRVIQCPKTDAFFLSQMSANYATTAETAAEPKRNNLKKLTKASNEANTKTETKTEENSTTVLQMTDNAANTTTVVRDVDATIVDENNVTTIVIESPSYASLANVPANNSSSSGSGSAVAADASTASNALAPSRSINVILDSADMLRRSAVKELLDTEVNYVKLLAAICEGYLPAMSKRIDIFSPNSIRLIFSNITAIYKFQRKFLEALRKGIEQNQVAKVFLKMHKGFLCYSTYCNAYPRALIELETYDRIKDARTILDNCRESENLAELPLSAHLLAPVQRICRYPLHLSEILKGAVKCEDTSEHDLAHYEQIDVSQLDIPDTHEKIDLALEAMRGITEAVNEGKRHSETIARHQASFQNFKGPPLHLHSTRFFLQIDATRQKQNLWNTSCTLFLFDNQLIYCKRDIIKRSHFIYKGRIFLDRCRVMNVRDGKMFGHNIRNSLRIYCEARDKWYDFSFRSANRKHRFLSTLALERQFGGKAFYVSEMSGFEYAYDERDYSDQSDYEMPECDNSNSSGGGGLSASTRHWSMADVSAGNAGAAITTSGDSSVPESPVKYKYSDTLPKKSQTRDTGGSSGTVSECQTGSLGRRRLGNWFRKPKSSHSTPNHSPTHKANELATAGLVGGSENNISINLSGGNYISSGSSA